MANNDDKKFLFAKRLAYVKKIMKCTSRAPTRQASHLEATFAQFSELQINCQKHLLIQALFIFFCQFIW